MVTLDTVQNSNSTPLLTRIHSSSLSVGLAILYWWVGPHSTWSQE